ADRGSARRMIRGLYTATTGMLRAHRNQETVSHNIANATTNGFRADLTRGVGFTAVLQERLGHSNVADPRMTLADLIGELGAGALPDRVVIDLRPGAIRETSVATDLALNGNALFVVRTPEALGAPDNEAYTRDGAFRVNAQGQLVTAQGYPVLGVDNQPIVVGDQPFAVDQNGVVRQNGQVIGQLRLVRFAPRFEIEAYGGPIALASGEYQVDDAGIVRQGDRIMGALMPAAEAGRFRLFGPNNPATITAGLFTVGPNGALTQGGQAIAALREAAHLAPEQGKRIGSQLIVRVDPNEPTQPAVEPRVLQGHLEGSNVDLTRAMTDMIINQRLFETAQRAVRYADETLTRALTDVGRVTPG
ncbi:MAG: flagellar hook-basal body protein, partial [Dehalococcoidia bacterium]|nr:flagellar hook-basal body protein [Dehalococcoidia bacterium]